MDRHENRRCGAVGGSPMVEHRTKKKKKNNTKKKREVTARLLRAR
jgi:hypothetical protein